MYLYVVFKVCAYSSPLKVCSSASRASRKRLISRFPMLPSVLHEFLHISSNVFLGVSRQLHASLPWLQPLCRLGARESLLLLGSRSPFRRCRLKLELSLDRDLQRLQVKQALSRPSCSSTQRSFPAPLLLFLTFCPPLSRRGAGLLQLLLIFWRLHAWRLHAWGFW